MAKAWPVSSRATSVTAIHAMQKPTAVHFFVVIEYAHATSLTTAPQFTDDGSVVHSHRLDGGRVIPEARCRPLIGGGRNRPLAGAGLQSERIQQ